MNNFMKKMFFAFFVLLVVFASGCTSKNPDEESTPATEVPPPPEPDVPAQVNPLAANRWCRAEDWDDFQVVMRMTLVGNNLVTEYLRLTSNGFDVYQYGPPVIWEVKGNMPSEPNKMSLKLIETDTAIQALSGFEEQKRIFKEVFSLNPNLSHPDGEFNPAKAMVVSTRSSVSAQEIERNVYPCENYSSTFNGEGTQRPLIEMIMIFATNSSGYTEQGRGRLAAAMPIAYPINEVKIEAANIANTQWCSWREVGQNELLLRSLTIGTDSFIENAHSQIFSTYYDENEVQTYLRENAARSERYQMAVTSDRLVGRNLTPADKIPRHPTQELFTMIQDANGSRILVRLNYKEPDRSWPIFSDLYFNCQDPRPLHYSPAFQMRLPDILSLQTQQLTGVVPPNPDDNPGGESGENPGSGSGG